MPWHHSPFDLQEAFSAYVWLGRSPDLENEKYVVWAGPAASLSCPAVPILEFQATGSESPMALAGGSGGGRAPLPPASVLEASGIP